MNSYQPDMQPDKFYFMDASQSRDEPVFYILDPSRTDGMPYKSMSRFRLRVLDAMLTEVLEHVRSELEKAE